MIILGTIIENDVNINKLINDGVLQLQNRAVVDQGYEIKSYKVVKDVEFTLISKGVSIHNGKRHEETFPRYMQIGDEYTIERDYR